MKLEVDFSELIGLAQLMSPNGSGFELGSSSGYAGPLAIELKKGIEVSIDDLDGGPGPLSIKGHQVLLYIKDHSRKFDKTVEDASSGNRFHLAHCRTLEEMRLNNRYQRYVATAELTGSFPIEAASLFPGGEPRRASVELRVCMNCLQKLNYRGSADRAARYQAVAGFSLGEFFSDYSTCFRYMPSGLEQSAGVGYTADWTELSKRLRTATGYRCTECRIDLSAHRWLCDVHHVNGVKSDNSPSNLRVLCKDCHRKQPMHGGIFISGEDMEVIQELRAASGVLRANTWKETYARTDAAVHGDLSILQKKGFPVPILGYEVVSSRDEVLCRLEAAWPDRYIGVNVSNVSAVGWTIYQVGEVCGELG